MMTDTEKVEAYLQALEKVLRRAPVNRRAEILLSVREQIQSMLSSGQTFNQVLETLGRVDEVSARFGYAYQPEPKRLAKITKWIFFILLFISLSILGCLWWLSQHLHEFADGNFEFHYNDDKVWLGGPTPKLPTAEEILLEDTVDTASKELKSFILKFDSGKIRMQNSQGPKLSWRCKTDALDGINRKTQTADSVVLNLTGSNLTKCDIAIPNNLHVEVLGSNGEIQILEPLFSMSIAMENGKIEFKPKAGMPYHYDFDIGHGRVDEFESSQKSEALKIKVQMTNGTVTRI